MRHRVVPLLALSALFTSPADAQRALAIAEYTLPETGGATGPTWPKACASPAT